MPWKDMGVMGQRLQFVIEAELGGGSFAALFRSYGITRKTGYLRRVVLEREHLWKPSA